MHQNNPTRRVISQRDFARSKIAGEPSSVIDPHLLDHLGFDAKFRPGKSNRFSFAVGTNELPIPPIGAV